MPVTRFVPMETFSKIASAGEATAEAVVFTVPYAPNGMIAQVLSVTTGALNAGGMTVVYDAEDKTVTVAVTALVEGDTVSLITF